MNLFRKIVASIALAALVISTSATGVSAYSNDELAAANGLAAAGVINDHAANPVAYNFASTILRNEAAKIAVNLDGEVTLKTTCNNSFADVTATVPNNWTCGYAEALLDAGKISANRDFNPLSNLTKSEATKMMLEAAGCTDLFANPANWQAETVAFAAENDIVSSFTDYNSPASRAFVFEVAYNAMNACPVADFECDETMAALGLCEDIVEGPGPVVTPETEGPVVTPETEGPVVNEGSDLVVTLSPDTPASATVPGNSNGLPVAKFNFTAGDEDVTVNQITLRRTGLSDRNTIAQLALFTDGGRVSNSKSDNQENNTEAQINLLGGGVVVMAGQTKTFTVVVDLGPVADTAGDEFAIEVVEVTASAPTEFDGVTSNTMEVGAINAPTITFKQGSSVANPNLGEENAEIFEFEIDGSNNEDVILKSVTFEGSSNAEDDLINFGLYMNNELIAETEFMSDDYLTFDLGEGLLIAEGKNLDFTVKADIIDGAEDTISFTIDEKLDVNAVSTVFGYGASVAISEFNNTPKTIKIEAGELTIVEVEAPFDEIREDKDNVVLGGFKLVNVAGENLELQEFGVRIQATKRAGSTNTGTSISDFFTDIELYSEDTGSSYELTLNGTNDLDAVFSQNNIDVNIPQGTTNWSIRVDTADNIVDFGSLKFQLSFRSGAVNSTNDNGGFLVQETVDNTTVTDIIPSSISYNTIDGSVSAAIVSLVPLADVTVVRGAENVVALQFELEASDVSNITLEEVVTKVTASPVFSSDNLPNQSISEARLYKGFVSDSNKIDQESNIASNGTISFNSFDDINIEANSTQTFIVTLSFVDGDNTVTNQPYATSLTSLRIEDDDNSNVNVNGANGTSVLSSTNALVSQRDVSVTNFGEVTIAEDGTNEVNRDNKVLLAGGSESIFSIDVQSVNESMKVEDVVFGLTGTGVDIKSTIINADLYLDNKRIETNVNGDIITTASGADVKFSNLEDLIITQDASELILKINTANIGYQETGKTLKGLKVNSVKLTNLTGVSSGKDASDASASAIATSKTVDVVPATLVVTKQSNSAGVALGITANTGNNRTNVAPGAVPNSTIKTIKVTPTVSNITNDTVITYTLYNSDDSKVTGRTVIVTASGATVNNEISFDLASITDANSKTVQNGETETFNIDITTAVPANGTNPSISLKLLEDGVVYDVNSSGDGLATASTDLTINLSTQLDLGSQ